jgi:hypothetical protein
MTTAVMSERQQLQLNLIAWLQETRSTWTAPYGILDGKSPDNKYRSVTFGISRVLDAEVRFYSTHYVTLRTNRDGWQKFGSYQALVMFLKERYMRAS